MAVQMRGGPELLAEDEEDGTQGSPYPKTQGMKRQ